jgi:hypothetical protein
MGHTKAARLTKLDGVSAVEDDELFRFKEKIKRRSNKVVTGTVQ